MTAKPVLPVSTFTSRPRAETNDDGTRTLIAPFVYQMGFLGSGIPIPVPAGTTSDGGSWPRFLHWYMHPWDRRIEKAAWLHDYLYQRGQRKLFADYVLYEAMGVLGASQFDRIVVLLGVIVGGWPAYLKHKRRLNQADDKPVVDAVQVIQEAQSVAPTSGEP